MRQAALCTAWYSVRTAPRHRSGAADLRNSAAGAVLPETVSRQLLAACCVRGCVLFAKHRAAGACHALCQRWGGLTLVNCAGIRVFQREGLHFVHASETGAWLAGHPLRITSRHAARARRNNPGSRCRPGWASTPTSTFYRCVLAATPSISSRCANCAALCTPLRSDV